MDILPGVFWNRSSSHRLDANIIVMSRSEPQRPKSHGLTPLESARQCDDVGRDRVPSRTERWVLAWPRATSQVDRLQTPWRDDIMYSV